MMEPRSKNNNNSHSRTIFLLSRVFNSISDFVD